MKTLQVTKSAEFKKISNKAAKFYSKTILLLCCPTSNIYLKDEKTGKNFENFCRTGYTVSKKIGNAVARNFAKRRLREAFKELVADYGKNHYDYVIIARREIANSDYKKILSDLRFCMKNIGRKNETKSN